MPLHSQGTTEFLRPFVYARPLSYCGVTIGHDSLAVYCPFDWLSVSNLWRLVLLPLSGLALAVAAFVTAVSGCLPCSRRQTRGGFLLPLPSPLLSPLPTTHCTWHFEIPFHPYLPP